MRKPFVTLLLLLGATAGCAPESGKASSSDGAPAAGGHGAHGADPRADSAELARLFPDGDDKGWSEVRNGAGHSVPDVPEASIPEETRAALARQLELTRKVVARYPTIRDAEAHGYRRTGPFSPGLGVHYRGGLGGATGPLTDKQILQPSNLIYDGLTPDAKIAGLMYIAPNPSTRRGARQPEGFAGPNDHWHTHLGICRVTKANGTAEAFSAEVNPAVNAAWCKARGGRYTPQTPAMLHVWTAPGYENPLGVFAHANPRITCADGTYHTGGGSVENRCTPR